MGGSLSGVRTAVPLLRPGGSAAVVATRAQGRMVDKVRTQPGGDLGCSSPQRKPGGHPTLAGALSIHLPGQDRRGNLGALPGVRTAGYHASRFALASRNLQPGASIVTGC